MMMPGDGAGDSQLARLIELIPLPALAGTAAVGEEGVAEAAEQQADVRVCAVA